MFSKKNKICIVDDSDVALFIIKRSLQSCGYDNVYEFKNYFDFIKDLNKLKKSKLFILDYHINEMNGLDFLKFYEEHNLEVPIIFITAQNDSKILHQLKNGKNVKKVFIKPFDIEVLCSECKNILENGRDNKSN